MFICTTCHILKKRSGKCLSLGSGNQIPRNDDLPRPSAGLLSIGAEDVKNISPPRDFIKTNEPFSALRANVASVIYGLQYYPETPSTLDASGANQRLGCGPRIQNHSENENAPAHGGKGQRWMPDKSFIWLCELALWFDPLGVRDAAKKKNLPRTIEIIRNPSKSNGYAIYATLKKSVHRLTRQLFPTLFNPDFWTWVISFKRIVS